MTTKRRVPNVLVLACIAFVVLLSTFSIYAWTKSLALKTQHESLSIKYTELLQEMQQQSSLKDTSTTIKTTTTRREKDAQGPLQFNLKSCERSQKYIGKKDYGGWMICPDGINSDSIVYSIGIGMNADFDINMIQTFNLKKVCTTQQQTRTTFIR